MVRSTNLPREIWVIRCVVAKGVEYILSLPVLVGFVIYYLVRGRVDLDWELVFFPLGILLQFLLLVGLGLVLAPLTVLATDMQRVVRIVLRFMFYLSPVLYGTHARARVAAGGPRVQPAQRHPVALPRRPVRARGVVVRRRHQRRHHSGPARPRVLAVRAARAHRAEGDLSR